MRLKDLNTTTVYAYRTSKHHTPRRIQVLDASQLYISSRRRASDSTPVPARPGARATIGEGYYGSTIGVLYREADVPTSPPALAMPGHIISTWAEWETLNAEEQAIYRRQKEAKENQYAENASNATKLKELMSRHPEIWPSIPYVDSYNSTQKIQTATLIQLLEALPQPAETSHV